MPADIFESDYRFPDHVTILAPGPNGKAHWSEIDSGSYVLAVNKAILIPVPITGWCVADWWAIKTEWLEPGLKVEIPERFFSKGLNGKRPDAWCSFNFGFVPHFTPGDYRPAENLFRPDGTVTGIAIELASRFGAKRITLCGVDMSGDRYHDGGKSESKTCPHGKVWNYVPYLNSVMTYFKDKGVKFDSLSPTTLSL